MRPEFNRKLIDYELMIDLCWVTLAKPLIQIRAFQGIGILPLGVLHECAIRVGSDFVPYRNSWGPLGTVLGQKNVFPSRIRTVCVLGTGSVRALGTRLKCDL